LRFAGHWRKHAGAAHFVVKLPGSDEQRVPNLLGLEALAREHRQQLVFRIGVMRILAVCRRLAVDARQQASDGGAA